MKEIQMPDVFGWLRKGFGFIRVENIGNSQLNSPLPVHIVGKNYESPDFKLEPGINPTFFLEKGGELEYAVINGFLLDLSKEDQRIIFEFGAQKGNAMIYR